MLPLEGSCVPPAPGLIPPTTARACRGSAAALAPAYLAARPRLIARVLSAAAQQGGQPEAACDAVQLLDLAAAAGAAGLLAAAASSDSSSGGGGWMDAYAAAALQVGGWVGRPGRGGLARGGAERCWQGTGGRRGRHLSCL